jgi:O-acetylhomoserine/O-acetylserine sulfhydrylase-like pyridoxal-dependent enzyme
LLNDYFYKDMSRGTSHSWVRVSVGLEHVEDIIADLKQALN